MEIRAANRSDAAAISDLLTRLSKKFITPAFNDEGRNNLLQSMTPRAIESFFAQGFRYHIGLVDDRIVGVVGTRDNSHLFHLFVDEQFQGKGYAAQLWAVGSRACIDSGENPGYFTVNSSLNAQAVYKSWGFTPTGSVREGGGVKDVPMRLNLSGSD